jgi:nucleotide-binding universal stress UspA family protein
VFKHILFPTDGSRAAQSAAHACIAFAAQVGARVTAVHVVSPLTLFTFEPVITDKARQAWQQNTAASVRACLEPVAQLARAARVPCATVVVESDEPYEAMLECARDHGCDLVLMASHGRKGVRGTLLGGQTQKLLTHSAIPVMVYRG